MKESLKRILSQSLFASQLGRLLMRNSAVVVAFHRVDDTDGSDPLTVDVESFERHCRFFQLHFNVISLRELVTKLEHGDPVGRDLVITFDDGYLNNAENAAPILESLGLPATFFLVSGWIGSDIVPWWDHKHGVQHPWMSWRDVAELQRRGFEIGAHTRTHVDLGRTPRADAHHEILGARRELEDRLGAPVVSFAYPYGGRHHLSESNRDLVKASGFRCCCSDFGGTNRPGTDPFELRRVPISPWYATPHMFGFDVALGRSLLST
jgi:peptidoglycan/xylan/chitin deacetylase (PgdA/CDA1 family)